MNLEIYAAEFHKNPKGPDGKYLRCSLCGSEDHFRAKCHMASSSNPGKSKGKGKMFMTEELQAMTADNTMASMMSANANIAEEAPWTGFTTVDMRCPPPPDYPAPQLSELLAAIPPASPATAGPGGTRQLQYSDPMRAKYGPFTSELQPPPEEWQFPGFQRPASSSRPNSGNFFTVLTWWIKDTVDSMSLYHTQVRLANGREGILVDTGAVDNLAGSQFADRLCNVLSKFGLSMVVRPLRNVLQVQGVGGSGSGCGSEMVAPIALGEGDVGMYRAPIIPGSPVPALWGLRSLREKRTLIDTYNGKIFFVGMGGYTLSLAPGSTSHSLEQAPTGHLLLPITEFKKHGKQDGSSKQVSL